MLLITTADLLLNSAEVCWKSVFVRIIGSTDFVRPELPECGMIAGCRGSTASPVLERCFARTVRSWSDGWYWDERSDRPNSSRNVSLWSKIWRLVLLWTFGPSEIWKHCESLIWNPTADIHGNVRTLNSKCFEVRETFFQTFIPQDHWRNYRVEVVPAIVWRYYLVQVVPANKWRHVNSREGVFRCFGSLDFLEKR